MIHGGIPLRGKVQIGGAKNAAVAILPATIMAEGPCTIQNVPDISDVHILLEIMESMGVEVRMTGKHEYYLDGRGLVSSVIEHEEARRMRASYYFLGAMLSRFGKAAVALPGGCNLGARPIDQHLKAFTALGCNCEVEHGMVYCDAGSGMKGAQIIFDIVSVGATINAMLAACKAEGRTILQNVAKEPHVVDVANILNMMGADIRGAGTDVIKINGVKHLRGVEYPIIPDQIEAGTFIAAAVATGGDVEIDNITPKHLETIVSRIREMGGEITLDEECAYVKRHGPLLATNLRTMPHPGFPTDMTPQVSVLLALAEGTSVIQEGISSNDSAIRCNPLGIRYQLYLVLVKNSNTNVGDLIKILQESPQFILIKYCNHSSLSSPGSFLCCSFKFYQRFEQIQSKTNNFLYLPEIEFPTIELS